MKIRKPCNLENVATGRKHIINYDSPELLFMTAVCNNNADDAVAFFREKKLFGNFLPTIDTPYGRYEGLDAIKQFVNGWCSTFHAQSASIVPVIQTVGGGRVALEAVINFVVDGEIEQVPMFIIADLRTPVLLDEIRIYFHFSFVEGLQAYRHPIFKAAHREIGNPNLLTGAMREYYEALGTAPDLDLDRILSTFSEDCKFGGYEPWIELEKGVDSRSNREIFMGIQQYMPSGVAIRFETIIDDGKTCVLEWVHIVSKYGQERFHRIALSGIAAYERNEEGLLCSVRVCDYAHYEDTIDWTKTGISHEDAKLINYVEEYLPYGTCQE